MTSVDIHTAVGDSESIHSSNETSGPQARYLIFIYLILETTEFIYSTVEVRVAGYSTVEGSSIHYPSVEIFKANWLFVSRGLQYPLPFSRDILGQLPDISGL